MAHPSRVQNKQCLGFTKERRRCRLERDVGSKTCHIHRNYYYQWIEKEIPKLKYCHWESLTLRTKKELAFQLTFRHIVLTQPQVEEMFWNFTAVDGYERLILFGSVDPMWMVKLFKKILSYYVLDMLEYLAFHEDFTYEHKYQRFIEALLPFPEALHYVFDYLHYRCILLLSENRESRENAARHAVIIQSIQYIWQISVICGAFRQHICIPFDRKQYLAGKKQTFLTLYHTDDIPFESDTHFVNAMISYEDVLKTVVEPLYKIMRRKLLVKPVFSEELSSVTIATKPVVGVA